MLTTKPLFIMGMLLYSFNVNADVALDIQNNETMKVVFDNALKNNDELTSIFNDIAAANELLLPDATTYATCNKIDANETIMTAVFSSIPEPAKPTLTVPVANAARECGVTEEDLLGSALIAGIDPTTMGEATAAGGAAPGAGAVGGNGAQLAAPTFGSAGGAGGGGVASTN